MAKRGGFPGGMPGNMANIMKQAQKMQKQMEEAQKNLEEQEVTAAAGGGAVDIGSEHKFHNFSVPFFFYLSLHTTPLVFIVLNLNKKLLIKLS